MLNDLILFCVVALGFIFILYQKFLYLRKKSLLILTVNLTAFIFIVFQPISSLELFSELIMATKTGSTLSSSISTGLSTQVVVMVGAEVVGAIQNFGENVSRPTRRLGEVGSDGTLEIVPNGLATISLTVNRIYFDGLSLPEAMSRGFKHIHAQRFPFDIVVIDTHAGDGDNAIITTYSGCWFKSLNRSYTIGDFVIAEDGQIEVEAVSSTRGGAPIIESQGAGGGRQIAGSQLDDIEAAADSGQRRGVLDFPGILDAAFS